MELQLTIFVILIFLVLAWNSALLWGIYREASRAAAKASRCSEEYASLHTNLKSVLREAESASERAVDWSARARERALGLDAEIERTQNWLRFGLAKVEFRMDRFSDDVASGTDRVKAAVSKPLFRFGSILHGVRAVLESLSSDEDVLREAEQSAPRTGPVPIPERRRG